MSWINAGRFAAGLLKRSVGARPGLGVGAAAAGLVACAGRGTGPAHPSQQLDPAKFNESSYNLGLAVRWKDDGDGKIEEGELTGLTYVSPKARFENGRPSEFLQKLIGKVDWLTKNLAPLQARLRDIKGLDLDLVEARAYYRAKPSAENNEAYRQALLNREMARRGIAIMEIDFSRLPLPDQQAIRIAFDEMAPHVEGIYLNQMDPQNLRYREEIILQGRPEDLFAFHNLGGSVCLTEGVDPICSPHPDSPRPTPNQGFWPADFNEAAIKGVLDSGSNEVKSSFVYRVPRGDGSVEWRSINAYTPTYVHQVGLIAGLQKMGAVPGLHPTMTKFLQTRATELKTTDKAYPFFDGDLAWINIQGGWDLTLGYYEEYHSPLGTTAIMEGFLGVVDEVRNRKAAEFAKLLFWMEDRIAAELGPDYKRRDFTSVPPLSFEQVVGMGDGRAKYVAAAFYLPNIAPYGQSDKSKKCFLTNNQTSRLDGVILPMAAITMDPDQLKRVNHEDQALFVVGHENAHGAGPSRDYVVRREGDKDLRVKDLLKEYDNTLEEARADLEGVASLPEAVRKGIITQRQAENAAIGFVAGLMRGLSLGAEDSHGSGAFVEFTTLHKEGAIYETAAGRYAVNLEKIFAASDRIAKRMDRIQLTGDYAGFNDWYHRSVADLPARMRQAYLPILKEMPKDYFPYYRFKFAPGV